MSNRVSVPVLTVTLAGFLLALCAPTCAHAVSHHRREQLRRQFGTRRNITFFPNNGFLHPLQPFPITGPFPYLGGYNRVRAYIYDRSYDPDSYLGRRNRLLTPVK